MTYHTYSPDPTLAPFIKCFWTLDAAAESEPEKQRIVPDGCMEMIFHYGDYYQQYLENGEAIIQPKSFIFGQLSRPLTIAPTGKTGIFAIRFLPDGFLPFALLPLSTFENRAVPLCDLFASDGIKLEHAIVNASGTEERIEIATAFLSNRLINPIAIDLIIKSSLDLMSRAKGSLMVSDLSTQLSINRRSLERRFSSVIGMSPKQLARIIRLQRVLKSMVNEDFASLTTLAYQGDYYDQAHFIKDFKDFTGVSPGKFFNSQLKLSLLFSGEK